MPAASSQNTILIVGASRGLGLALAAEFLNKGWDVMGTVRAGSQRSQLHELADMHPGRVEIEILDICEPEQIAALEARLSRRASGRLFDILFVNAGTTNQDVTETIGEVSTDEFVHVMVTNALSPMRVVESLEAHVEPAGLVGVMSSGQGSIGDNENGQRELYRGSKAALNMFMRSYAVRHAESARAMLLLAPGWIRTDLGGPNASFTLEESAPKLVDVMLAKKSRPGLEYLDRAGATVPW